MDQKWFGKSERWFMPGRLLANMEEVEMLKVKLSWIFDIPAAAALPGPVPTTRHPPSLATGAYDPIMHGHYNYYTLHSNHHSKILKKGLTGQVVILNDCPQEEGISPRGAGKGSDWGATEWAWPGGGAEYFISSYLLLISPHLHIIQLSRTFF